MKNLLPAALALGALAFTATSAQAEPFGSTIRCGTSADSPHDSASYASGLYSTGYGSSSYGSSNYGLNSYGSSNYGSSQCDTGFCGTADVLGCRDGHCDPAHNYNSARRPASSWTTGYRGTRPTRTLPVSTDRFDSYRPSYDRSGYDRPSFDRHSAPTYTGYSNSHFSPRDRFGY